MKIFDRDNFDSDFCSCVLAFGNFDGVHNGHKHLLENAKDYASDHGLKFGVYTFIDSPKFKNPDHSILTTLQFRLSLIDYLISPDFVYLENFDTVKDMSPDAFVDYITGKFGCECGFCGENFKFGKDTAGDSELLLKLMSDCNKEAVVVPSLVCDGEVVSSSRIRALLQEGNVSKASELLGDSYGFCSEVVHGAHLGTKIGFPTINQIVPDELVYPKYGVYATFVVIDGREYMGVTDFGVKPTVSDDGTPVAETYILDFSGDIYGENVGLFFVERLRDETKFSSLDELQRKISDDVEQTKKIFKVKYENN